MKKEEILKASRKENANRDLVEAELAIKAGNIGGHVGVAMCFIISLLARILTDEYLISPWIIFFSILGTDWLVRAIQTKKKTSFIISAFFLLIAVVLFVLIVLRFIGKNVHH